MATEAASDADKGGLRRVFATPGRGTLAITMIAGRMIVSMMVTSPEEKQRVLRESSR